MACPNCGYKMQQYSNGNDCLDYGETMFSRWFGGQEKPVRRGFYECEIHISFHSHRYLEKLYWDGERFASMVPLVVVAWRGLTARAYMDEVCS